MTAFKSEGLHTEGKADQKAVLDIWGALIGSLDNAWKKVEEKNSENPMSLINPMLSFQKKAESVFSPSYAPPSFDQLKELGKEIVGPKTQNPLSTS